MCAGNRLIKRMLSSTPPSRARPLAEVLHGHPVHQARGLLFQLPPNGLENAPPHDAATPRLAPVLRLRTALAMSPRLISAAPRPSSYLPAGPRTPLNIPARPIPAKPVPDSGRRCRPDGRYQPI